MSSSSDSPFKKVVVKNNPTLKQEYRLLTIKSVRQFKNSPVIELGFEEFEKCPYTIEIDLNLFPKDTNIEKLVPGEQLLIKGKNGNLDYMLWGHDKIADIKIPANQNDIDDIQVKNQNDIQSILPFVKSDK